MRGRAKQLCWRIGKLRGAKSQRSQGRQTERQLDREGEGKEPRRDLLGLLVPQLCVEPLEEAFGLVVADRSAAPAIPAALLLEELEQIAHADPVTDADALPQVLLRQVLREGAGREGGRGGEAGDSTAGRKTAWHGLP